MNYFNRGFNRLSRAGKLFVLFTAAALVSGAGAVFMQITAADAFGWKSSVYREEYILPFKAYLNISVTNIPLYVGIYSGDEIRISYVNETALLIEENEYSYSISQDADFAFSLFSLDLMNYSAEILLPDRIYRDIKISSASGVIEFSGVAALSLDITSRSGDIIVNGASGEVRIKNRFGNVAADFDEFSEECVIENETGNVSLTIPRGDSVLLDFSTESGCFTSDFFKKEYKERFGNVFVTNGKNAKKLSVITVGGDLLISAK